jgi:hypothetical protein
MVTYWNILQMLLRQSRTITDNHISALASRIIYTSRIQNMNSSSHLTACLNIASAFRVHSGNSLILTAPFDSCIICEVQTKPKQPVVLGLEAIYIHTSKKGA